MRRVNRIFLYLFSVLIIAFLFFSCLTVRGYSAVYHTVLRAVSRPIIPGDENQSEYAALEHNLNRPLVFAVEYQASSTQEFAVMLDMIRYIQHETSLRYLVTDFSYCTGELLNNYLETGDTGLLDFVLKENHVTGAEGEALRSWLLMLWNYNRTLPAGSRLRFFGINTEGEQPECAYRFISELIVSAGESEVSDKIHDTLYGSRSDNAAYFSAIAASHETYPRLYQELFAAEYFRFEKALNSLFAPPDAYGDTDAMSRCFIDLYDRYPRGKYWCMLSDCQCLREVPSSRPALNGRLTVYRFAEEKGFWKEPGIYTVDNRILRHFTNYFHVLCRMSEYADSIFTVSDPKIQDCDNEDIYFIVKKGNTYANALYRGRFCAPGGVGYYHSLQYHP